MQMTDVVNRRRIRHAHMVNINHQIMLEGMRADFLKVDRISTKVVDLVRRGKQICAQNGAGNELNADLKPEYNCMTTSWVLIPGKSGNMKRRGEFYIAVGE